MTPQAIRDGFEHLRSDEQMHGLADAARCRSEADWLVGINGTRAMTAFNSRDGGFFLTTVGRVQTPTLSIVVEREEKIRKYVARDYWEVHGTLRRRGRRVRGQVVRPGVEEERRRRRAARRPRLERARGAGHRRGGARQAGDRHRGGQAEHAGAPAAVRPDLAAARGQRPLRLLGQDHAVDRAGAVREAQGADLSADRLARPARGLPAGRQADDRDARQGDLPGPLRAARGARDDGARRRATSSRSSASSTTPRSRTTSRSSRRCRRRRACPRSRRSSTTWSSSASWRCSSRRPSSWSRRASRPSPRPARSYSFQTNGKVLVKPGWLAIYGKEAQEDDANLVPVAAGEMVRTESVDVKALKTRPPARYTEATLLGGDGRRRQADRRRRAARGDAGEGPGHAGHARGDHRRPDQREVHATARAAS